MSERHEPVARKVVACALSRRRTRSETRSFRRPSYPLRVRDPNHHFTGPETGHALDVDLTVSTLDLCCHVFSNFTTTALRRSQKACALTTASTRRRSPGPLRDARGRQGQRWQGNRRRRTRRRTRWGTRRRRPATRRWAPARLGTGFRNEFLLVHGGELRATARGRRRSRGERRRVGGVPRPFGDVGPEPVRPEAVQRPQARPPGVPSRAPHPAALPRRRPHALRDGLHLPRGLPPRAQRRPRGRGLQLEPPGRRPVRAHPLGRPEAPPVARGCQPGPTASRASQLRRAPAGRTSAATETQPSW